MAFRDVIRRSIGLAPGQFFRSKQKASEVAKTLLFVVPLTVLIWVYAERAQVLDNGKAQILFNVSVSEPTQSAEIVERGNSPVSLTLSGPRAAVERLKNYFERRSTAQSLTFQLTSSYRPGTETISIVDLINSDPYVDASGVTVTEAVPPAVKVRIDSIVAKEVTVRLPPELAATLQNVVFDPQQVTVRGPESVINAHFSEYSEPVTVDLTNFAKQVATPGPHVLSGVPLKPPKSMPKDAVTFVPASISTLRFDVSSNETELNIESVAIEIRRPITLEGRGAIDVSPKTITNLRVRGPADAISKLSGPVPEIRPVAVLRISSEDLRAGSGEREVQIADLPPNVVVTEAPKPVRWEVRSGGDVP